LSHKPSPFFCSYILDRVSHILPGARFEPRSLYLHLWVGLQVCTTMPGTKDHFIITIEEQSNGSWIVLSFQNFIKL
jgi:hypothetical protein